MFGRYEMARREPSQDLSRPWLSHSKQPKRCKITMECTPKEFRSKLEDFFKPYILSARSDGNFDRACFRTASHDFAQHLRSPELAYVYYSYVIQECYEFISADKKTMFSTLKECIIKKLEIHGYQRDTYGRFRYFSPDNQRLMRIHGLEMFSSDDEEDDYYTLMKNRSTKIEVPHYERDITGCTLEQLIYKPFLYQDFECIKNLLLYMMPVTFVTDDLCDYRKDVIQRIKYKDPSLRSARYCDTLVDEYCDSHPARRTKLLLMSVDFVVQKRCEVNFSQKCINSLKLFMENIPDARITSEEVSGFLLSIVKDLDRGAELLVSDFCKNFEEEFPESALPFQPRSLKHLCRWQIRRSLSLAQHLPVGIERMGIPIAMQKYLSLE